LAVAVVVVAAAAAVAAAVLVVVVVTGLAFLMRPQMMTPEILLISTH